MINFFHQVLIEKSLSMNYSQEEKLITQKKKNLQLNYGHLTTLLFSDEFLSLLSNLKT
jgi:hypothetical protein